MTHQIYPSVKCELQLRKGPMGAFVDELAAVLLERGYPRGTLCKRFAVITELNRWLVRKEIKLCHLNQRRIHQFVQNRSKQTSMIRRGEKATLNLLFELLRAHGEIPPPETTQRCEGQIDKILDQYNQHLVEEKGLSFSAVSRGLSDIRRFLSELFVSNSVDFHALCVQNITEFVREYAQGHNCGVSALMVCSLRSFLRFLLLRGKIVVDLASCVPTVPNRKHASVPQYLSAEELEHLLERSRGDSPAEIRNYAILLLLARLGLRASEIVALTLDDIDWEHGELTIRGKGARQSLFPLPMDVGEALVCYLKNGRPSCATRRLFICARPPVKPLKSSPTVSSIVCRCLKKAGLNPPKKGAHLLRHTLATECLRRGATLPEIGEILRHRQIDTTAIYAKVDFTRLETIARPWPDPCFLGGEA